MVSRSLVIQLVIVIGNIVCLFFAIQDRTLISALMDGVRRAYCNAVGTYGNLSLSPSLASLLLLSPYWVLHYHDGTTTPLKTEFGLAEL